METVERNERGTPSLIETRLNKGRLTVELRIIVEKLSLLEALDKLEELHNTSNTELTGESKTQILEILRNSGRLE